MLDTNLLHFDEKISELKEAKEMSKLQFEKMIADKDAALAKIKEDNEAQIAELEEQLHIKKTDLISLEEELFMVKAELNKEKNQINHLQEEFKAREKTLTEQLEEKESLLSRVMKDKEKAQKILADTLTTLESKEKNIFSEVNDKLHNFNTEHRSDGATKISEHKNKISADIKSMFEATRIRDLAKKGFNKVRDRIDDMKK